MISTVRVLTFDLNVSLNREMRIMRDHVFLLGVGEGEGGRGWGLRKGKFCNVTPPVLLDHWNQF